VENDEARTGNDCSSYQLDINRLGILCPAFGRMDSFKIRE
jgi:hypothetical protein